MNYGTIAKNWSALKTSAPKSLAGRHAAKLKKVAKESKDQSKQNAELIKSLEALLKSGLTAALRGGDGAPQALEDSLKNCRAMVMSKKSILPMNPPQSGPTCVTVLGDWLKSAMAKTDDPRVVGKSFIACKKLYLKQMISAQKGMVANYSTGMKTERKALQKLLKSFSRGYSKQLKAAEKADGESQAKALDKLAESAAAYAKAVRAAQGSDRGFGFDGALDFFTAEISGKESTYKAEAKKVRKKS